MEKVFKTYDQQISLLVSKGLDISTPEHKANAKKYLQHEGYYRLINGYSNPFYINHNTYIPSSTIEEIYILYQFDEKLRNIFFTNILAIEKNIKNLIAYSFSEKHGHCNYLVYNNFNNDRSNSVEQITALIADLNHQVASRSSDPIIQHYLSNHGYVPLWVMNTILTFGQISKFYSLMKPQERQSVSKIFSIQDFELENILFYLSKVRNLCAHSNRLFCYRNKSALIDLSAHKTLEIPINEQKKEYEYGKRDLYAACIAMSYLLSDNDFKRMIKDIYNAYHYMTPKLKSISGEKILGLMGFPSDWKEKLQKLTK